MEEGGSLPAWPLSLIQTFASYAGHYGLQEILTEDLQHDRLYGAVRVVNPFMGVR